MRRNKPLRFSFTVLEALVALLIVSILLMISVPIIMDYRTRAKISEGFELAAPVKNLVAEFYMNHNRFTADHDELGLADPDQYRGEWTESVTVDDDGRITIAYSNEKLPQLEGNNTIILAPNVGAGRMSWSCTEGTLNPDYRPRNCRADDSVPN